MKANELDKYNEKGCTQAQAVSLQYVHYNYFILYTDC